MAQSGRNNLQFLWIEGGGTSGTAGWGKFFETFFFEIFGRANKQVSLPTRFYGAFVILVLAIINSEENQRQGFIMVSKMNRAPAYTHIIYPIHTFSFWLLAIFGSWNLQVFLDPPKMADVWFRTKICISFLVIYRTIIYHQSLFRASMRGLIWPIRNTHFVDTGAVTTSPLDHLPKVNKFLAHFWSPNCVSC